MRIRSLLMPATAIYLPQINRSQIAHRVVRAIPGYFSHFTRESKSVSSHFEVVNAFSRIFNMSNGAGNWDISGRSPSARRRSSVEATHRNTGIAAPVVGERRCQSSAIVPRHSTRSRAIRGSAERAINIVVKATHGGFLGAVESSRSGTFFEEFLCHYRSRGIRERCERERPSGRAAGVSLGAPMSCVISDGSHGRALVEARGRACRGTKAVMSRHSQAFGI